jgi:DNA repair protein RecO (recombination protein O)
MLTKDTAICIRAVDYSETSQILTLFTKEKGKISAIAKGSKRPKSAFDGPIEVFSYGRIVVSIPNREKLATLTEFEQQTNFNRLADNLFVLNCSFFAAELINLLTNEYDPHPGLFDSFLQFLQNANDHRASRIEHRDTLSLLILFQLALLKEVGLQPVLKACVNCKNDLSTDWPEVYFSSFANGLICRDCQTSFPDKIRLDSTAANCLADLKLLADSDERTLKEIEEILIHHFTELLRRPPKMAKYILKT